MSVDEDTFTMAIGPFDFAASDNQPGGQAWARRFLASYLADAARTRQATPAGERTTPAAQQPIGSVQVQDTYSAEPVEQPAQDVVGKAFADCPYPDDPGVADSWYFFSHGYKAAIAAMPRASGHLYKHDFATGETSLVECEKCASVPDAQGVNARMLSDLKRCANYIYDQSGVEVPDCYMDALETIKEAERAMQKGAL